MRTGKADLPLHYGRCPSWLFRKMKPLARAIVEIIVNEYSQEEFLRRLSDPFWFQAFSCVLGFDWHSSGVTTTVCGALKEGIKPELGIAICGGKGRASRKAPEEIIGFSECFSLKSEKLVHASRLSAKVDNTMVQDGYNLYHHCFIFTEKGKWMVIQQGMNPENRYARRYHWLSESVKSFVEEPHKAICCKKKAKTLNMVARESREARKVSVDIVRDGIERHISGDSLLKFQKNLKMPKAHSIINMNKRDIETLKRAKEINPSSYEELISISGIGPKSIRALALISKLVYGSELSWKDPAEFSFAHGGKDGYPRPVDRETYQKSIEILETAVQEARIGKRERLAALRRLNKIII